MKNFSRNTVIRAFGAGTIGWPALAAASVAPAKAQPKQSNRDAATKIIADARRIVTANGIELLETIRIGGIDQWVSVRGADKHNPVLILIHGGPGYISIPMSWWFSRGWEDYFTVVQWDQRGSGKTYLLNDPETIAPTLTLDRMALDTEEVVHWARTRFDKNKVFVLGHSWGSYLGLELAIRHPDWLYAYIGVGQITNSPESERRGWDFAMDGARRAGNIKAINELQSIAPYFPAGHYASLKDIYLQRRWLDYYGGVMAYRRGNSDEGNLSDLSPDYTDQELPRIWVGNDFTEKYLLQKVLSLDLSGIRELRVPLIIFAGRFDVNVNSQVAAEWFSTVNAPAKRFVWFENSAHLPMTEERGKFLVSLVNQALPMASSS
jgi:proline iminopeptidase